MKKLAYIFLSALTLSSCNYLDITPVGQVIPGSVSEYRALLTEAYGTAYPATSSHSYTCLLSDEVGSLDHSSASGFLVASDGEAASYNFRWEYTSGNMQEYPWLYYYRTIFLANAVIEGIGSASQDTNLESKDQLLGEAYALRAYCHFELINLYGKWYDPTTANTDRGVPLALYNDIEQSYRPSSVAAVYQQILDDLKTASDHMQVDVQPSTDYSYRFSKKVLTAFEARVRLYMGQWQEAYDKATSLLASCTLQDMNETNPSENLGDPDDERLPWLPTSPENILALDRPFGGFGGDIIYGTCLSDGILSKFDRDNDRRWLFISETVNMETWETVYKVSRSTSARTSIRSSEVYLIAAEAAAHLDGKLDEAKGYLTSLQAKRFTPEGAEAKATAVAALDQTGLLAEIADERAREFLLEGHRWLDLRRTTRPQIVKTYDGQTYTLQANDSRYTLPYPQSAIENNPELNN